MQLKKTKKRFSLFENGKEISFCTLDEEREFVEILYIQTSKRHQRRGCATRLIEEVKKHFNKDVTLTAIDEVILPFYFSRGFEVYGKWDELIYRP